MDIRRICRALLCLCLAMVLGGCNWDEAPPTTTDDRPLDVVSLKTLRKEVKWLAGDEAEDCGFAELEGGIYGKDKAEIDCCVATNIVQGKPFYVLYEDFNEHSESIFGRGYVLDDDGDSSAHTWDRSARHDYNSFECEYIETPSGVCSVPVDDLPSCIRP